MSSLEKVLAEQERMLSAKAAEKDMSRSDFIRGAITLYLSLCDLDEDRLRAFKEFAVRFL